MAGDWAALVDAWRGAYMPSMDEVRRHPERGFVNLDTLHRTSLERLVHEHGIKGLSDADLDYLNRGLASAQSVAGQRRRPDAP